MIQAAIAGLVSGGVYALLGVCVVLLYRMVGVLNLAQAAIGVFGMFVVLVCYENHWPLGLAVAIGLLTSAVLGGLLGGVMAHWFSEASLQVRSSVTIAFLISILTVGMWIFGSDPRPVPNLVGTGSLWVGGLVIPHLALVILGTALLLAGSISLLLQHTLLGVWLRALAERPTAAELLGVPAQALTVGVWAVAGAISCLAILLIAPSRSPEFPVLSLLVLPGMAAALLGLFKSFSLTILGGLGIGLIEGLASSLPAVAPYRQALWFLVMLAALLWIQRKEVWDAAR